MMITYDPNRPLYLQIAEKLEIMIQADSFPDFKLPTERELSTLFRVSVMTIKQSLGVLVQKDLIYRRPRCGTFIKRQPPQEEVDYNELQWLRLDTPKVGERDSFVQGVSALYELEGTGRPLHVLRRHELDGLTVPLADKLREADVYTMNSAWARELHRQGALRPLDVGAYDLNPDLLDTSLWEEPDETMWAVPVSANISCLYCNRDVFEEFGLDLPVAGMSWEELGTCLQALPDERQGESLYRFGYVTYAARFWQVFLWQMGLEIFDEEDRCLMDREENVAAIAQLVGFLHSLQVDRVIDMSIDPSSYFQQHKGRNLACFIGSPRFHRLVSGEECDRWVAVPLPTAGRRLVGATAVLVGVNADSSDSVAMSSLMDLLVGPRGQNLLARENENMAISRRVGHTHFREAVGEVDLRGFLNEAGYEVKYEEPWEHASFLFFLLQDMFRQCVKQPDRLRSICADYTRLANQRGQQKGIEMEVLHAF